MGKYQSGKVAVITILVVLVIAGVASWIYLRPQDNKQENNPVQTTLTATPDPTESWETLSNLNYSLSYPSEAKAEARDTESIIYYMGQKQIDSGRTQTELFDGYSFRIGIIEDAEPDLNLTSNRERRNAVDNCDYEEGKISELKNISVSDQQAFQYSATGCYVDYTETFVSYEDVTYRISQSYVGDIEDYDKYKETTNQILSSVVFEN